MKVGVQLPEAERVVRWPEVLAMARAAEEVGFESIWLGDHLLYRGDGRGARAVGGVDAARGDRGGDVARSPRPARRLRVVPPAGADREDGGVRGRHQRRPLRPRSRRGLEETEYRAFGLPYDHRVSRFEESFEIVRRLVAGERVTLDGRFWSADDLVLLPPPARRIPLMIGSNGPRMLSIALPHVDWWNTWYDRHGNTVEGFAELNAFVTAAAEQAGRDPAEVARSTAVLVELDPAAVRRPHSDRESPPVALDGLPAHLAALAEAGADEAILILRPITEDSVRAVGLTL